jgi:uncharacterized protein (DUF433 family)
MNSLATAPRGWYLADEVGQLAGVSGERIGQWARHGYIRSSRSADHPRVYSFQDIAEAMVVHELIDRGVPVREIRNAVQNLRRRYGDWPLTVAPLAMTEPAGASGRRALVLLGEQMDGDAKYDIGRGGGAQLFLPTILGLREITTQLRTGGWAIRTSTHITHIEVNPDRLSGHPTIRGRRIPAKKVAQLAETEEGKGILRSDYDLSPAEIGDAVQWLSAVREYDPAA